MIFGTLDTPDVDASESGNARSSRCNGRGVNMGRGELTVRAEKAKTRRAWMVPVTTRLRGVLQKWRIRLDREAFGPEDFVFGDAPGQRIKSVGTAWDRIEAGGARRLSVARSHHEAGSRLRPVCRSTT